MKRNAVDNLDGLGHHASENEDDIGQSHLGGLYLSTMLRPALRAKAGTRRVALYQPYDEAMKEYAADRYQA